MLNDKLNEVLKLIKNTEYLKNHWDLSAYSRELLEELNNLMVRCRFKDKLDEDGRDRFYCYINNHLGYPFFTREQAEQVIQNVNLNNLRTNIVLVLQRDPNLLIFTDNDVIINRPLPAKLAIYSNGEFIYEDIPLSTSKKKELRQYYLAEIQKYQEVQEMSNLRSELETLKKRLAEKDELLKLIKINLSKE